jgi:hypothetical protein
LGCNRKACGLERQRMQGMAKTPAEIASAIDQLNFLSEEARTYAKSVVSSSTTGDGSFDIAKFNSAVSAEKSSSRVAVLECVILLLIVSVIIA